MKRSGSGERSALNGVTTGESTPAMRCASFTKCAPLASECDSTSFIPEDTAPMPRPATLLGPVSGGCREDGLAARRLGRPVQRVGDGLPLRVVRHLAMRLERGLVLVDLVEVVDVLVLLVLQDVEAETVLLVPLGAERIGLDRFEEALAPLRLDPDLHPDRDHGYLLMSDMAKLAYCILSARSPHSLRVAAF